MYSRNQYRAIQETRSWRSNSGPNLSLIRALHLLVERYNAANHPLIFCILIGIAITQIMCATAQLIQLVTPLLFY